MDDLTAKIGAAGEFGCVALVIIIIASAHEQKPRSELAFGPATGRLRRDMPTRVRR